MNPDYLISKRFWHYLKNSNLFIFDFPSLSIDTVYK